MVIVNLEQRWAKKGRYRTNWYSLVVDRAQANDVTRMWWGSCRGSAEGQEVAPEMWHLQQLRREAPVTPLALPYPFRVPLNVPWLPGVAPPQAGPAPQPGDTDPNTDNTPAVPPLGHVQSSTGPQTMSHGGATSAPASALADTTPLAQSQTVQGELVPTQLPGTAAVMEEGEGQGLPGGGLPGVHNDAAKPSRATKVTLDYCFNIVISSV